MVSSAMAQVSSAEVTSDTNNVYYRLQYAGSPSFIRIFIDQDNKLSTGYRVNGIGSGYLIENGRLYRYSGNRSNWNWIYVKNVPYSAVNGVATISVARSDISPSANIDSIAQTQSPDGTLAKISTTLSTGTTPAPTPSPTPTPTPEPAPSPTPTFTNCATEGATCTFTGTRQVRYGANGIYAYKTATGSIACNNETFGDPVVGVLKSCSYSSEQTTATPTPTPSPEPTVTTPVSYSGTSSVISNPDRGFYNQVQCSTTLMSSTQLQSNRVNNAQSLVMCAFDMGEFLNSPLSQAKLDIFQRNMDVARTSGVKVILRLVYNYTDSGVDAPLPVLLNHLDQLKPYITANKDVISVVQAGLVGSWGEWANSINYGQSWQMTSQNWTDRGTILNKLLATVPTDRMVQLRTPGFAYRLVSPNAVTATEAFNGTNKARVGQHNDCFLTTQDDWGTYLNLSVDYPYMEAQTTYTAMGGETCAYRPPRSDCPTATAEMAKFHWSYLNAGYNMTVLDAWKNQGCYNIANQKLGYRFVLKDGKFSNSAKPGGGFFINLNLVNEGYAAPFNSRPVELILRNNSSGAIHRVLLNVDPRRWLPGQSISINQTVTLPSGMENGNYSVLLALPDAESKLKPRPEYSIQLANTGAWEPTTGFNKLNHTVNVAP